MTEKIIPPGVDPGVASPARIYDYYLGGKDNFAADREAAEALIAAFPSGPVAARQNRSFLIRAVRRLAEEGVRQFLDVGSGLPTQENVHEVARLVQRDARVLYTDLDPVAVVHARALLAGEAGVHAEEGDLRDPEALLATAREHLDLGEPIAVLLAAVTHFVSDADGPHGLVSALMDATVSGSHLLLSQATADMTSDDTVSKVEDEWSKTSASLHARTRDEVMRFFDGLVLLDPGVVPVTQWCPDEGVAYPSPAQAPLYAGVARKA
ncbi:SAM-dependent methyltransferase [Actinomadura chokoriensis]|uniref:SAM-dependent methyltransferase n=1 Tax=Actinomadura chokoriensis TaxID=454156 RepID=UPI0031F92FD2